jgi:hypothetical protein
MKIELKLTADQVFALAKLLEQVYDTKPTTSIEKMIWSICMDIASKFTKKQLDLYSKQSLFDTKKKHNVSLKFHEAYSLHCAIESCINNENDIYSSTILRKVLATLNQKLA